MSKGEISVLGPNTSLIEAPGGNRRETGRDFEFHIIEERELITTQNTRSDDPIAKSLVAALDHQLVAA